MKITRAQYNALLDLLRPSRTSPTLERALLGLIESAWYARALPELFADGRFDGVLARSMDADLSRARASAARLLARTDEQPIRDEDPGR